MNLLCWVSTAMAVLQNIPWFIFRSKDWSILKEKEYFIIYCAPHSHLALFKALKALICTWGQCCLDCTHTLVLRSAYWRPLSILLSFARKASTPTLCMQAFQATVGVIAGCRKQNTVIGTHLPQATPTVKSSDYKCDHLISHLLVIEIHFPINSQAEGFSPLSLAFCNPLTQLM